ncbi:helix-turn-helix transcriptional regulator [Pedobacter sp. MR2016-24]|uniref:helix-turn-helix transcriptional regulator n=1 Tax=Pedobacter sp. MR2016-24 TaxID=2994466 RepID=UPI0022457262|nr:helix-turn-helix transcriptional regulator [Pedobacter sp. MR2016-24]MCX2483875.1 helix-turn-helix transcriptional regulator [Pedobacter sp. MR2016-24]
MKISVIDKGSGITKEFARAIGATVDGRFIHIPENKGAGYMTGFSWGKDLRMMIRNYYLKEEVFVERTNELAEGQDDIIFMLSGILPSALQPDQELIPEQANIMICRHAVSSVISMPSNTLFGSVTIAVSRQYLLQLFGRVDHPVVRGVLEARDNFILESGISSSIIHTASEMLQQVVPGILESQYYKLKCEELLFHIFAILMRREGVPNGAMHVDDIKAIYAVKSRLQLLNEEPPHIAALAKDAGMSEPKLRKLFRQTFGKGVFEYYQFWRIQKAAQKLREGRLTVSEVGYQLGFTNLSHFSRVFEQLMGIKPKKYSSEH